MSKFDGFMFKQEVLDEILHITIRMPMDFARVHGLRQYNKIHTEGLEALKSVITFVFETTAGACEGGGHPNAASGLRGLCSKIIHYISREVKEDS